MSLKNASVKNVQKSGLPDTSLKTTRWSEQAANGETLKEYPRPGMKRKQWINLNGWWDYVITSIAEPPVPKKEHFQNGKILVPFSPESPLSGVEKQIRPGMYLWYHREVDLPEIPEGWHYLLHFGAVDQICDVYVDHVCLAHHVGGYLPFSVDLPADREKVDLVIRVRDVSDTSYHSRGKQKLNRGGMYYTAQSGIWQTVWMEPVPKRYIKSLKIDADPDTGDVKIRKTVREEGREERILEIRHADQIHLWSPEDPYLYDLSLTEGMDQVETYFAFRKLEIKADQNGYPRFWCYML